MIYGVLIGFVNDSIDFYNAKFTVALWLLQIDIDDVRVVLGSFFFNVVDGEPSH